MSVLFSQDLKKVGTTGFVFLELPSNARVAALGESGTTLTDVNSDAIFINPALAGFQKITHSLSFTYSPWLAETKHYLTSYAFHDNIWGTFSVGAIILDYGTMTKTERIPGQQFYTVLGSFEAKSTALCLSYSRAITDKFSFGVGLKYVNETIDKYNANNILLDGGFIYWTGIGSLRIAGTLQNFGTNSTFNNKDFRMPILLRIGLAYDLLDDQGYKLTLMTDAIHPSDNSEKVNTGLEFGFQDMVFLRAGYKFNYDEETYSLGVGIKPMQSYPFEINFSFTDFGRLNNVLRLTLQAGLQ